MSFYRVSRDSREPKLVFAQTMKNVHSEFAPTRERRVNTLTLIIYSPSNCINRYHSEMFSTVIPCFMVLILYEFVPFGRTVITRVQSIDCSSDRLRGLGVLVRRAVTSTH